MELVALHVYVPLSPKPTTDIISIVDVLVDWIMNSKSDCWEVRILPFGEVQVMLGTGRPSNVQISCTLLPWTP